MIIIHLKPRQSAGLLPVLLGDQLPEFGCPVYNAHILRAVMVNYPHAEVRSWCGMTTGL